MHCRAVLAIPGLGEVSPFINQTLAGSSGPGDSTTTYGHPRGPGALRTASLNPRSLRRGLSRFTSCRARRHRSRFAALGGFLTLRQSRHSPERWGIVMSNVTLMPYSASLIGLGCPKL